MIAIISMKCAVLTVEVHLYFYSNVVMYPVVVLFAVSA